MSINRWLFKQNMVYTYSGISFSHKKERSEISQTQKDKYFTIHLHETSRTGKLTMSERRSEVTELGHGWNGKLLLNNCRSYAWGWWKTFQIDGGDVYTTLWMYLMLLNFRLTFFVLKPNWRLNYWYQYFDLGLAEPLIIKTCHSGPVLSIEFTCSQRKFTYGRLGTIFNQSYSN